MTELGMVSSAVPCTELSEPADRYSLGAATFIKTKPSASLRVNSKCPSYITWSGGRHAIFQLGLAAVFFGKCGRGIRLDGELEGIPQLLSLVATQKLNPPFDCPQMGHGNVRVESRHFEENLMVCGRYRHPRGARCFLQQIHACGAENERDNGDASYRERSVHGIGNKIAHEWGRWLS